MNPFPVEEWRFSPRSPWILLLSAVFLIIAVALVGGAFAYRHNGETGGSVILMALSGILCGFISFAIVNRWWVSRQNTQQGGEFFRLDEDGLSFHIYPHGSGCLKYEWLRIVQSVHERGAHYLNLEYRASETGAALDTLQLDVSRIRMNLPFWQSRQDKLAELIKARCPQGQLYDV